MAHCLLMITFTELGLSVPLFLGDVTLAEGFEDARKCVLCGQPGPCLPLDVVLVACPSCGGQAPVWPKPRPTDSRGSCPRCSGPVHMQDALAAEAANALRLGVMVRLRGCVGCLRAGRWAQTHIAEVGAIGWETSVEADAQPGHWAELLRTPRYATFQGERWLFCHELPMIYLGEWGQADFEAARPGAGCDLFAEIIRDVDPDQFEDAWAYGLQESYGELGLRVYAFRCQRCDGLRTHSDCD